jgi:DNA-directed RNA polymerase II subunit RPB4
MSHRTSRPKPPPPGNEEAGAVLNLGEFQDVDTLTLSEAALVLNALVAKRRNDRKNVNETEYVVPFFFANSWRGALRREES